MELSQKPTFFDFGKKFNFFPLKFLETFQKKLPHIITIAKTVCSVKKNQRKFFVFFYFLVKIMQKMFRFFRKKRGKHNDATEACIMKA